MQYGFHFNAQRCTGCKTCVLACKDYHDLPSSVAFRQVYEYGGGHWEQQPDGSFTQNVFTYHISVACNHCNDAVCLKVCPTGAMHRDDRGLVSVDVARCIGCGYCALSCPYRAPKVDREVGHSVKCNGCTERIAAGKQPICVEACPLRALDLGPIDEIKARHGELSEVPPLPDAGSTKPNLVITPPRWREKENNASDEGHVMNIREIV